MTVELPLLMPACGPVVDQVVVFAFSAGFKLSMNGDSMIIITPDFVKNATVMKKRQ